MDEIEIRITRARIEYFNKNGKHPNLLVLNYKDLQELFDALTFYSKPLYKEGLIGGFHFGMLIQTTQYNSVLGYMEQIK